MATTQKRLETALSYIGRHTPPQELQGWVLDHLDDEMTIAGILDQLDLIDAQLNAARSDSQAVKVGELTVNYQNHVNHLLGEGSRTLAHLSNLVGVLARWDKYAQYSPIETETAQGGYAPGWYAPM